MKIKLPKFFDLKRDGVTQSMLMEFAACRQRAKLGYIQGYTSEYSSNALVFGSMFHSALEYVYKHWKKKEVPSEKWLFNVANLVADAHEQLVRGERFWTDEDQQTRELNVGYLCLLLPRYFKIHWPKDSDKTWIRNEHTFKNSWRGVISFTGKFDRVARNKHNEVWIYETKTKSKIDPALQDRLSFDFQANFYILNLLLETNIFPKGFVYDIVQRPQHRIGKKEILPTFIKRVGNAITSDYFQRITVTRERDEFEEWLRKDLSPLIAEFLDWYGGVLPTYRNPSACETRYGACKFIKVCGLKEYRGLYKRKILFPELVEGS